MYTSKTFRVRDSRDVIAEIEQCRTIAPHVKKVFLADGNAMALPADKLLPILEAINNVFPRLQRISAYALPSDFLRKTERELNALKEAGLTLLYVGIESGDDDVLRMINKSETYQSTMDGLNKANEIGFDLSVMILNGIGGKILSRQHAENSALLINQIKPKFLSTLVLSYPFGLQHFKKRLNNEFTPLTARELIEEMSVFIGHLELENCIFRSDHVSNFLSLKGILNKDKLKILENIRFVLANPQIDKLNAIYSGSM